MCSRMMPEKQASAYDASLFGCFLTLSLTNQMHPEAPATVCDNACVVRHTMEGYYTTEWLILLPRHHHRSDAQRGPKFGSQPPLRGSKQYSSQDAAGFNNGEGEPSASIIWTDANYGYKADVSPPVQRTSCVVR